MVYVWGKFKIHYCLSKAKGEFLKLDMAKVASLSLLICYFTMFKRTIKRFYLIIEWQMF